MFMEFDSRETNTTHGRVASAFGIGGVIARVHCMVARVFMLIEFGSVATVLLGFYGGTWNRDGIGILGYGRNSDAACKKRSVDPVESKHPLLT
jgi:hypothetical protein